MKRTNLRAVYKGEVKNDSRKKKVLEQAAMTTDFKNIQTGFMYDLEIDVAATGKILVKVFSHEDLKLKYETIHEFLSAWADINSI